MGGYFQDFEKVRTRRRYVACTGCSSSWIWADRINAQRWGCNKCGTPWPGADSDWKSTSPVRKPRGRVRPQVDPPPGLGAKTKQVPNAIESTLKKAWGTMPPEAQAAYYSQQGGSAADPTPTDALCSCAQVRGRQQTMG